MKTYLELFEDMWQTYISMNPQAKQVYDLFTGRGERVENDHIALRTYNIAPVNKEALGKLFEDLGYKKVGEYDFEQKKLKAVHFEAPNPNHPKVFISELLVEEFSDEFQEIVKNLVSQVSSVSDASFVNSGRPWQVSFKEYEKLASESEYGAWLAAFGFVPNHFTVSFNHLNSFSSMEELNRFLKDNGIALNSSGGELKGTPEEYLVQSSTLANSVTVDFSDGPQAVASCYYEFARRYPLPSGELFQGFIAKSADKIFESTDRQN